MYETFPRDERPVLVLTLPVTETATRDAIARYLGWLASYPKIQCVVGDREPFGDDIWIYYYQSAEYVRTGDFNTMLVGNAPFLVDVTTGEVFVTGTVELPEEYVAAYRNVRASKMKISR